MKIERITRFALIVAGLAIWQCAAVPENQVIPGPHAAQVQEMGQMVPPQELYHVFTGLDVLTQMDFELLRGTTVGVVTNHTAVSREGKHLVDLLAQAPDVTVKAIFAPEHGFRGEAQGGDDISSGIDSVTGIRLFSLYGADREPSAEMMDGIEVLVFDIQDVGTRFYTYISTMGYVLEAGAKFHIPVMVLDRPNPIGRRVDGNVLEEGFESFVGRYKIPIQYGLSIGELARMIVGEALLPNLENLELHVVECQGWPGDVFWQDTDLTWVPPSPNMRNTNETLTYPGLCLLEGVRINEGRGTELPFEQIGAPYMDGALLARELLATGLKGFSVEPVSYIPMDMPGVAMNPLFEGEMVQGVKIRVTDPAAFVPIDFLLNLLVITKKLYPQDFAWRSERGPDRLWGGSALRELIDAGSDVATIKASYAQELEAFKAKRAKYLIYSAAARPGLMQSDSH